MKHSIVLLLLLCSCFLPDKLMSAPMERGVDPENLGTGQWIYFLAQAVDRLGGHVDSVNDIPSLMKFYKKSGIDYIVVKSGTGAEEFPRGNSQFTRELIDAAHAEGLKIFGYTRSNGIDVPGEIALAINNIDMGADGFVIDAEEEWESHKLKNAHAKAIQLCQGIKARYPNIFLGHAPFPIISKHSSFPYKEFGLFCDAVMPQAYWKSIRVSPTEMVEWMNQEWHAWHNSLQGADKKAIKPIAPIGQGWSPDAERTMTGEEISEFIAALNHHPNPASPTGYKGVSYWRTDLHTPAMWKAIKKSKVGQISTTPTSGIAKLAGVNVSEARNRVLAALTDNSEAPNPAPVVQSTPAEVVAIEPEEPQHANDFIVDNHHADAILVGNWYAGKAAKGFKGTNYFCANTTKLGKSTATAVYRPLIRNSGNYDIFVWYIPHANRSTKAPWYISFHGGSEIVTVNQTIEAGGWYPIARNKPFESGTEGFVSISNDTGEREKVIITDAVRFVRCEDPAPNSTGGAN